jgi:methylphosphotriester-DNA--protein-cysteine methyltransferase
VLVGDGQVASPPPEEEDGDMEVDERYMHRLDARFMEMDPDAYEIAEGIAELFESLDQNRDNQISLEEFLDGAKRHPELLDLFFNQPGEAAADTAADMHVSSQRSLDA